MHHENAKRSFLTDPDRSKTMNVPRLAVSVSICIGICGGLAATQDSRWPSPGQLVKIIVPTSAGGGTDIFARLLSTKLHESLGAAFIVENRPGASGNIGTVQVKDARANGDTLLFTQSSHTTNVAFFKNLPYDPVRDFAPIALIGTSNFVLCVNANSPVTSIRELVEFVRAKDGKATYGSGGHGTPHHLAGEVFKSMADVRITHVPYRGTTPAVTDLLAGVVDMVISTETSILPYMESGKARCLASTARERSPFLPQIPTVAEAVPLPGFEIDAWHGLMGPAGLPNEVIDVMNREVNRMLADPDVVKKYLVPAGVTAEPTTPERFLERIKADVPRYIKLGRDANIVPE
jgi:tripartite-type tricarboxylate transporter receptor subunit TctC